MMQIPERIPGLRWLAIVWAGYLTVWAVVEGGLWATVITGALSSFVFVLHLARRMLAGKILSLGAWLLVAAVCGALVGLGSALLTLLFMAVKTGLHAHGPEFSDLELNWVFDQMTLWTLAGLFGGLGLGLLLIAVSGQNK